MIHYITTNLSVINLTIYLIGFILLNLLLLGSKKKTLFYIPVYLYISNMIVFYIIQIYHVTPLVDIMIWSTISRTYESVFTLGMVILSLLELRKNNARPN